MKHNPTLCVDGYKVSHEKMYNPETEFVLSNFTPRSSRVPGIDRVVFFGLQSFLQDYCVDLFSEWFAADEDKMVADYERVMDAYLGPKSVTAEHIRALHRLGYLPLRFCALPEGTLTPLRVPMFTVENTLPEFFWLTNYIESVLSCEVWLPCTTATTAWHLRRLLDDAARKTSSVPEIVDWQGHDFSLRGMTSIDSAAASGAAHLLSFTGTDSVPSLEFVDYFYGSEHGADNGLVGGSVPATEHSIMCIDGEAGELGTFERLMRLYPTGILSVVSDTWDLWGVLTKTLPELHDAITARDGKLVIRPDSGDPVDIVCGNQLAESIGMSHHYPAQDRPFGTAITPEEKGVLELLWDEFGGTVNEKGYRELDSHVGVIYGDSITYDRAKEMVRRMEAKGFASTNVVFGVGSFSYQLVTRDTFGFAVKATWAQVNGVGRDIFKDPVTDNGIKKSATGRLAIQSTRDKDGLRLIEHATAADEMVSALQPVWQDGVFLRRGSFADVRATLAEQTTEYEAWRR